MEELGKNDPRAVADEERIQELRAMPIEEYIRKNAKGERSPGSVSSTMAEVRGGGPTAAAAQMVSMRAGSDVSGRMGR